MGFDTAYEAMIDAPDDQRWAFGTGFADPFAGLDSARPEGVDGATLGEYCVMLADDALIMSHRLQQWITRAPELEEETALANIALDLLGQARLFYTRAGGVDGSGRDEDAFAFRRSPEQFRNLQFVEAPSDDFAVLTFRLFVFSAFRLAQLERLRESIDPVVAAIAAKGAAEVTYHRDYAADWVIRLGDGTAESRRRMDAAVRELMPTMDELFAATPTEQTLVAAGAAADPARLREPVTEIVRAVLAHASLSAPVSDGRSAQATDRRGEHTTELADILDELQSVAREHEGATW